AMLKIEVCAYNRHRCSFLRLSPLLRSPIKLTLAHRGRTAQRVDIPKSGLDRKILDSDFAGHFGSGLAAPHNAELRFGAQVQNVDNVARLEVSVHALQGGAATADRAQAGGLSEGAGMSVHAPDLDGKV